LIEELNRPEVESRIGDTAFAQPAIFAIQVSLAAVWQSWGIQPSAFIGHSVGEVAAAYLAGALDFEDAVRVIYQRGRCMSLASKGGGMLAVALSEAEAEDRIGKFDGWLNVAAVNAPRSLTISGDMEPLRVLADELQRDRVYAKFLKVNQAFHSRHMDPAEQELLSSLTTIQPRPSKLPLISTVIGGNVEGRELTAEYWWRNIRQAVRFSAGIDRLLDQGYSTFLELSPHPVLVSSIAECAMNVGKQVKSFGSLTRQAPELPSMLRSLGALYCAGFPVDWRVLQDSLGRYVPLPSYPWQREVYWHEAEESRVNRLGMQNAHPLLGHDLKTSTPLWQSILSINHLPYMQDHRVQGVVIVPATAMLETAMAIGKENAGSFPYFIEEVKLLKAILLPAGNDRIAQAAFDPQDSTFQIRTGLAEPNANWSLNCTGKIHSRIEETARKDWSPKQVLERCTERLEKEQCYQLFEKLDIKYGPDFQGIKQLWRGQGEALGEVVVPEGIGNQIGDYQFHPAILDACLQCVFGTIPHDRIAADSGRGVFLPVEIQEVRVYGRPTTELYSHARLESINRQSATVQLQVYDMEGNLLVDIRGLVCQYVGMRGDAASSLDDLLYEFKWRLTPTMPAASFDQSNKFGSLTELVNKLAIADDGGRERQHDSPHARLLVSLNQLSAAYIVEAFERLGWSFQPDEQFSLTDLITKLGVANQHFRVIPRYLQMLEEEGILGVDSPGRRWRVIKKPNFEPSLDSWRKLLRFYPAHYAELTMIRRCATRLDEVLRGELNPLPLIFPEGSLDTAEHLYQDSPSVRIYNLLAQKAISELIAQLPPDRTIRILEIGAGTGGLTSYLLPHLPVDRTQYVFSDLSNHFFIKSKQKLADFPFVDYRLLDIEKDPLEQKFAAHSFDIVIASQVLHATEDLTRTLTNVRKLVSDGGLLVMLELLKPARWVDLVFGLTEGWWRFKDLAIRPDYPLLPFEKWRDLLVTVGFGETVNVAQSRQVDGFGSAVILSRAQVSHRSDSTTSVAMDSLANGLALGDKNSKILASKWLVFADQGGLGTSFAEEVHRQGGDCYLVRPGNEFLQINEREFVVNPRHLADFRQLLEQFADASPPPMILHLWNLDAADNHRLTPDLLIQAHDVGCLSMVHLYQAWSKTVRSDSQAWVVTRNGQSTTVGSAVEPIQMAQTSVWGLCRVLFNEYSRIKGRLIDLGGSRQAEVATLVSEITLDSPDDEVVLRDSARYVNRYLRSSLAASHSDLSEGQTVRYRLDGQFGELDALAFRECARVLPARDQIEIEVRAAALNFSDVMKALGLYPGLPDGPVPIGIECAGRVVSVGADVTGFRIGDDVLALAPFALGSHVTTHEKLCVRMPKNLDYTEATTIPIAFLTASFCLENLARLQPGERILIHSAAGGVGLAAIQIAQNVGAEVFATAGSSEKREFLRSIGIEHVMNSRTLAFTDQIMELTNGQGVDVVLNSLSGEALSQSMSVLGEFGRFVEIGKRDIYMNRMLGMRPFKKNVSFMAVDLDRVMREKPALMAKLLQQVVTLTDDGRYQPLPHRVFSATNIKSAFRYMAQAKHIGKVVVSFEDSLIQPLAALPEPMKFREDATYFISGGLGGFGLLVAQWMAENGAKNFILMGRRGIHSDSAKAGVERLRKMGSNPLVVKGDVARPDDVQRALSEAKQLPPVRGVLHAAMHLEDCLLNHLDRDTMLRVVEPKVLGAWNLHLATLDQPLDFFVSFSSMASVFGLPGQANYAAANVFLDSLPNYRRQIGASGLTINWGYLREVGYVAERMELVERFESQGFTGISPVEALALLGRLMTGSSRHVSIVRMDWSRAKELGLPSLGAPRFQELVDRAKNSSRQEGAGARRALLAVLPEKRKPILLGILKERVGAVLGAAPDKIDVDTPLTSVGVDSLMAVELRNWVESELRVSLPIVELMEGPTVNRLADLLLEQFSKGEQGTSEPLCENSKAEESPSVPTTPVFEQTSLDESVVTMVAELSDAEVDAMLSSLVESSENTDPKGLASFSG
jgi:NADPH:quinone reductase-like Zn-dependent oxidoreductase/malonyl CoA-acyl carrier protein transacylase/SAM-dependent methyltransferase/acyl carrier protein/NADP-dependent 3-hydroxy acid dehydrogenase YdfG